MKRSAQYLILATALAVVILMSACDSNSFAPQRLAYGDVNLNETAYEIADAVLFSQFFVLGDSIFDKDREKQIAATDVNRDGIPLTVADLRFMVTVILGDAVPYTKVKPDTVRVQVNNGYYQVDDLIGAARLVVEGDRTPELLVGNTSLSHNFDGSHTRLLISDLNTGAEFEGDFLRVEGELLEIEMATPEGGPVVIDLIE